MLIDNIVKKICFSPNLSHLIRPINSSCILNKTVPDNLKGKSKSSQDWLTRQLNDIYVQKSRYDRYRCRSAYKLLEIDEKYKILKPHIAVVDCGAAPGSWTQVIVKKLNLNDENSLNDSKKGMVVAVDLRHIEPIKGAIILSESDFTDPQVQEQIYKILPNGKAHVVLSDMAPNASGTADLDSVAITNLVYSALRFAMKTLTTGGTFVCKVWDNSDVDKLVQGLNTLFSTVKRIKPKASRTDSSELFLLAMGFKGKS